MWGGKDGEPGPAGAEARDAAAAGDAIDNDRLIPGEDPTSMLVEDATHWTAVYSELLEFKQQLITDSQDRAASLTPVARREINATDLVVLRSEASRFERRLGFWRDRLESARAGS